MTSGTVSSLIVFFLSCNLYPALAQQQAQFNQVLNLNGDMNLNSFVFPDRSKVETFSQSQRQLIVNQNTPSIPPNQVTGSTGQPFVALMQQSMAINTNGANDLVGGQIELVMNGQMLQQNAVNPDNVFVAQLSPDRQTWMITEPMQSVNVTDMTVRFQKKNNIDGEYMALGRQTNETKNVLVPFGNSQAQSVVIQGSGLQENEFVDGFRMSVRATQPITMNVDVKNGVNQGMLTQLQGQQPVNNFRYLVTTNLAGVQPDLNRMATVVQLPINAVRVQQMMQAMGVSADGQVQVGVAQRPVQQNPGGATGNLQGVGAPTPQRRTRDEFRREVAERQVAPAMGATTGTGQTTPQTGGTIGTNPQTGGTPTQPQNNNPAATQLLLAPTFTPIQNQAVLDPLNMRIAIPVSQVDGEFIITMQAATGGTPAAPQAQAPPTPAGEAPKAPGGANSTTLAAEAADPPPERRADNSTASIDGAPKGYVYLTMREVNRMVEIGNCGGMPCISKMMSDLKSA
ncbi:hypothetical protein BDV96DRAFT_133226 [Lophiotrema nucula]|uniref:Uncharacterized protein n=1 Tax=Lophiotrema nucula TaxID=690887 RepID=A0A6A5ZSD1_9PLEO|nr:hypothetical protein BDV96DRAFT_133226 [Lophiotrema nucula]